MIYKLNNGNVLHFHSDIKDARADLHLEWEKSVYFNRNVGDNVLDKLTKVRYFVENGTTDAAMLELSNISFAISNVKNGFDGAILELIYKLVDPPFDPIKQHDELKKWLIETMGITKRDVDEIRAGLSGKIYGSIKTWFPDLGKSLNQILNEYRTKKDNLKKLIEHAVDGDEKSFNKISDSIIGEITSKIASENTNDGLISLEKDFYKWFMFCGLDIKNSTIFEAYLKLEVEKQKAE